VFGWVWIFHSKDLHAAPHCPPHRPKTAQHWSDIALQVPPKITSTEKFSVGVKFFVPETSMEPHMLQQWRCKTKT
jgi:hypothetical protein